MNSISTILGIFSGLALMAAAIIGSKAEYKLYLDLNSLYIVLGGTIAATLTSFNVKEVLRRILSFIIVFFSSGDTNFIKIIKEISETSFEYAKSGNVYLNEKIKKIRGSALKDGLNLHINGYKQEEIRLIMEENNKLRYEREQQQVMLFRVMAKVAPAFGMIGTMIGLVNMLKNMGTNPDQIGPQMAIALITTFYGLILANMFFNPVAEKLAARADSNFLLGNIMTEGIILIIEKKHPIYIKDRLCSYLPPRLRMKLYLEKGKKIAEKNK